MTSRTQAILALGFAVALLGCSGSSASGSGSTGSAGATGTTGNASTSTGSSGSGSSGSIGSCPDGAHASDGGCAATLTGWSATSALEQARDHHVSFVAECDAGAFLFVGLGTNYRSNFRDFERAAIQPDGTLGAFTEVATVSSGIAGAGLAQIDATTVVTAGGLSATSNSVATTYVGKVDGDGSLSLTAGPALETARYHLSLVAHGGYVYALGGIQQSVSGGTPSQTIMDTVERASFDGTTLGDFEALDPLPAPLTHQAAVVYGDALYLVGGVSGSAPQSAVLRAAFTADGKLGPFLQAGTLPAPRVTAAAFTFLDQLYVLAGGTLASGGETASVLRATIADDGSVGTFETLPDLPAGRQHCHQAPLWNGFIYSAGGSAGRNVVQDQVFVGALE